MAVVQLRLIVFFTPSHPMFQAPNKAGLALRLGLARRLLKPPLLFVVVTKEKNPVADMKYALSIFVSAFIDEEQMDIDWNDIVNKIIIVGVSGSVAGSFTWIIKDFFRMRKDVNANFRKMRKLYRKTYGDKWVEEWEEVN